MWTRSLSSRGWTCRRYVRPPCAPATAPASAAAGTRLPQAACCCVQPTAPSPLCSRSLPPGIDSPILAAAATPPQLPAGHRLRHAWQLLPMPALLRQVRGDLLCAPTCRHLSSPADSGNSEAFFHTHPAPPCFLFRYSKALCLGCTVKEAHGACCHARAPLLPTCYAFHPTPSLPRCYLYPDTTLTQRGNPACHETLSMHQPIKPAQCKRLLL